MSQIVAGQHIFASVDREQSPRRQRGYQTLFYTRDGLDEQDLQILEARAQYYSTPDNPTKWQFFWLPGDRWVLSRAIPLQERDEFGRTGRYLSHSLIFPAEAWFALYCAPFGLLTDRWFIGRLDQAFQQGDLRSGNIPRLPLPVPADWQDSALTAARRWPVDALRALARLVWPAQTLQAGGPSVITTGPHAGILEVLLVGFLLAAPSQRRFLTFDTHALNCNWGRDDGFWLQGFPEGTDVRGPLMVNAGSRQVQADPLPAVEPSPYARWMEEAVIPRHCGNLLALQDWAVILDKAVQGQPVDHRQLAAVDPGFAHQFADLNATSLRRRLEQIMPPGLSPGLARQVFDRLGRTPYEQMATLTRGVTSNDVANLVYEAISALGLPPTPTDQQVLASLAQSHAGIRRLMRLWKGDLKGLRQELDALPSEEYRQVVTDLLATSRTPAWQTLSPRHVGDWLEVGLYRSYTTDMVEVATALAECGGGPAVDHLADFVSQMPPDIQQALYTWFKKSFRGKAPQLQRALEQALGKPESTMDRLKGLLFGSDEEPSASRSDRSQRKGRPGPDAPATSRTRRRK